MYISQSTSSLLKETVKDILDGKIKPIMPKAIGNLSLIDVLNGLHSEHKDVERHYKEHLVKVIVLQAWVKFEYTYFTTSLFESPRDAWYKFMETELYTIRLF